MTTNDSTPIDALLGERDWLHSLSRRLTRDAEAAADLAQEVWLASVTQAPAELGQARAWLYRVATRIAQRRRQLERSRERRERERGHSPAGAAPDPADTLQRTERLREVVDAVLALDEADRTVVLLRYFETLGPAAIAERLELPEGTVRSRLSRALTRLRPRLARFEEEPPATKTLALVGILLRDGWRLAPARAFALGVAACSVAFVAGPRFAPSLFDANGSEDPSAEVALAVGEAEHRLADPLAPLIAGAPAAKRPSGAAPRTLASTGVSSQSRRASRAAGAGDSADEAIASTLGTGLVVGRGGRPIDGARVELYREAGEAPGPAPALGTAKDFDPSAADLVTSVVTGRAGRFAFAPDRIERARADHARLWLRVQAAGHVDRSLELEASTPREIWLAQRDSVLCLLRDAASGQPLDGARLETHDAPWDILTTADERDENGFRRDSNGRPAGKNESEPHVVRFSGGDGLIEWPTTERGVVFTLVASRPGYATRDVVVDAGPKDVGPFEIELTPGRRATLEFVDAQDGTPLAGALLFDRDLHGALHEADEAGRIELSLDPARAYCLVAHAPRHAFGFWKVAPGEIGEDATIRLALEPLVPLCGLVVDESGAPVAGARVTYFAARSLRRGSSAPTVGRWIDSKSAHGADWNDESSARSGPDGRFELHVQRRGPWSVRAHASRLSAALELETLGGEVQLQLSPRPTATRVVGRLVDSRARAAAGPGAGWPRITVRREESIVARPDLEPHGTFELGLREPGSYRIEFGGRVLREVDVAAGAETQRIEDIDIADLTLVDLCVARPDGSPLAECKSSLRWLGPKGESGETPHAGGDSFTRILKTGDAERIWLPWRGRYSIRLDDGACRHPFVRSTEDGDAWSFVLPESRDVHVRLLDARTDLPLPIHEFTSGFFGWKRPGEPTVQLAPGLPDPRRDGFETLLATGCVRVALPREAIELQVRPEVFGYRVARVPLAADFEAGPDQPLEVRVERGARLELDWRPSDAPDEPRLSTSLELYLVRADEAVSTIGADPFADGSLFWRRFQIGAADGARTLRGLAPGGYEIIGFEPGSRAMIRDCTRPSSVMVEGEFTRVELELLR